MSTAASKNTTRTASIASATTTLETALAGYNASIAAANRVAQTALAAAEATYTAAFKTDADLLATDFLAVAANDTTIYGCIIQWRSDAARSHITAMIALLQGFDARSQSELGAPLRNVLPALAFAKVLVAGNANLRSVFGQREFFLGSFLEQQLGEASGALIKAQSTIVAEAALKQLELALTLRIDANAVVAPSADQIAVYNAQLASGREGDFSARLKALGL